MNTNFLYSSSSTINNDILDSIDPREQIVSLSLNIKASHSGKVNGNYVFYTPRSMRNGSNTLVTPFKKHLQKLHRGDAVGVINSAEYKDYTDNYSPKIQQLSEKINTATTRVALVAAVNELVKSAEYRDRSYKGLGVLAVSAELFNSEVIQELTTGDNKGTVSIGGSSDRVYCSICSQLFDADHEHKKGKVYDGSTCFAIYDNMFLDHIGFVPDPADNNTETNIIHDSLQEDNSTAVTIDNFKIQDNLQGHSMNIEQLKQSATSAETLINLEFISKDLKDVQKESLKTQLTADMKTSRKSGYLFSEDKLVPLTSKQSVAIAIQLVEVLEDSPEKKVLQDLLVPHKEKHFAEEDVATYLSLEGLPKETEKDEATLAAEAEALAKQEEDKAAADALLAAEEAAKLAAEQATATVFNLSDADLERIVANVSKLIDEKLTVKAESVKVEDSINYDVLLQNNKQLTLDVEAISELNAELTSKYKTVIISQILSFKGLKGDAEYAETLSRRDLTSLTDTLEDLEKAQEAKDLAAIQAKENKDVNVAVKDSQTVETKELAKVALEDSLTNLKTDIKDNTQKQEPINDKLELIKELGLAGYLRLDNKG